MKKSGTHEHDFWDFASNEDFLKWRKKGFGVPAKACYYVNVMCEQYPSIDGKFADRLAEDLKSDSNVALDGSAGCTGRGKERKLTKGEKEIMQRMEEATQHMKETEERKFKQRQQFIELQAAATERTSQRDNWQEYMSMCKEFKALKKDADPDDHCILCNLATRLRDLEKLLKIPDKQTVTTGYYNE
jgi:hypothetical protein